MSVFLEDKHEESSMPEIKGLSRVVLLSRSEVKKTVDN